MDSILGLEDCSNLKERRPKTPSFDQDSEICLRRRVGLLDIGLSGSGDRIGVGGTFGLRLAHLLKCLRTEHAFFPLTQVSQVYHNPRVECVNMQGPGKQLSQEAYEEQIISFKIAYTERITMHRVNVFPEVCK
jgi:hypothetical protein